MKRRGFARLARVSVYATALTLVVALVGDRGRAATVPAGVYGQDPLEVLSLSVKPNVVVILDTSGSMAETPYTATQYGGDFTGSKMYQAKQVMKSVFQANQTKVQFLFGTYRYSSSANTAANMGQAVNATPNRFLYSTQSWAAGTFANPACTVDPTTCPSPNPANVTVPLEGPSPSMATTELAVNNLYAYQWLQNSAKIKNNVLFFTESSGASCTVSVTPGFYISGAAASTAIQNAMNSCAGRANFYTVVYGVGTRTVNVTSITRAGTTATVTTSIPHGFATGNTATIAGATQGAYNIAASVTVTSTTQFTYTVAGSPATPATGTITASIALGTANTFTMQGTGTASFTLKWSSATATIRGPLNAGTTDRTVAANASRATGDARINLLARTTGNDITETFDPDGASSTLTPALDKPSPIRPVTTYFLYAQKFWNGETVYVDSTGAACGIADGTATNPPTLTVQRTTNCANGAASADPANKATFTWGGGQVNGAGTCQGFQAQVPLIPCDQLSPLQYTGIAPFLDNQLPLAANGSINGYSEIPATATATDGTGSVRSNPSPGGVMASSNTPLAQSLDDIRVLYANLWNTGQAVPALDPIKNHVNPKERTIVLMVTDGDQNCTPFTLGMTTGSPYSGVGNGDDSAALGAAAAAQKLYDPAANGTASGATVSADGSINGDVASSVTTYVVAFGAGASKSRADFIAWGGSGMKRTLGTYSGSNTWTTIPTAAERSACKTCVDSYLAPDPDTLRKILQSVLDVGATSGEFTAQQSITESVYEYVDVATTSLRSFDARSPISRFGAIVPTRFVSSFSLPGFKGQVRAYQNDGAGNSVLKWSAGDKLSTLVTTGMSTCNTSAAGGAVGQCVMTQLHGGATDANIATSSAAIKRRIYTTSQNGVYAFSPATLMAGTASGRLTLWPPPSAVAPADYTSQGSLDGPLGLPLNSATNPATEFTTLKTKFQACVGNNLPAGCTSATALTKMQAARREARDMIFAFMAGAASASDAAGPRRTTGVVGTSPAKSLLFQARPWPLADSELATTAVVTPPSNDEPDATPYVAEYKLYVHGSRDATGHNPDTSGVQIKKGFGLTLPDDDGSVTTAAPIDSRNLLKPVMTVIYVPANDMLHAFRAGPSCSPAGSGCAETGGEELWGFIPFDQVNALYLRLANDPQTRANHVYMLARGIRFADIFVRGALTNVDVGGVTVPTMQGVWRRVLFFGRGIGGKYVTALDVTAPAAYTSKALDTVGPIPLWNRGNPDTLDGTTTGSNNGSANDRAAYARMGETWSIPTAAFVNHDLTNPIYKTTRQPNGIDFALFMGSGFGKVGEGTTHYTLDALSGDVIAAVDVETAAASYGLTRSGVPYANALVANSVSFNRVISGGNLLQNRHPWSYESARVYVGDLHGRLWKILTVSPDVVVPAADLGADQPVGTAVALVDPTTDLSSTAGPFIFVSSGAELRAAGPFRNFTFRDDGTDTNSTTTGTSTSDGVTTFAPVVQEFVRTFDQGSPLASCTFTSEAVFRGTVQPTGTFECSTPISGGKCTGTVSWRVFFAGTRLSPPATKFAPPTKLACGTGDYPCRSQFDSILYALGAETGQAAYDLNATGDDAYRIFRDSRIAAISMQGDPDPGRGGSSFAADEGLMKGTPKPPPPPGVPPTATTATANVIQKREPGYPAPAVRYGSTVCQ